MYIYGLGEKIIVAESGFKGGTWNGVIDGLKKIEKSMLGHQKPDEDNGNQGAYR